MALLEVYVEGEDGQPEEVKEATATATILSGGKKAHVRARTDAGNLLKRHGILHRGQGDHDRHHVDDAGPQARSKPASSWTDGRHGAKFTLAALVASLGAAKAKLITMTETGAVQCRSWRS